MYNIGEHVQLVTINRLHKKTLSMTFKQHRYNNMSLKSSKKYIQMMIVVIKKRKPK